MKPRLFFHLLPRHAACLMLGLAVTLCTQRPAAAAAADHESPSSEFANAEEKTSTTPVIESPATQTAQTQPATSGDAQVDEWLTRIQASADKLQSFRAKLRYDAIKGLERDRQRRFGSIVYVPGPPARFNVRFTRLVVDDRAVEQDRRYIFNGEWLVERLDDEKLFIKRQILGPDADPTQADPLRFGQGPFSLPVTLKKNEILGRFKVSLAPTDAASPANAVGLRFVPLPSQRSPAQWIDVWYEKETLVPVRASTLDDSENETHIDLTEVKVNEPFDASEFDVTEPKQPGWRVEIKPYEAE